MSTDYALAACKGYDPAEWDDYGTPEAHAICRGCPIVLDCLRDALQERPVAQMRGGHVFPGDVATKRKRKQQPKADRVRDDHIVWWISHQRGLSYSEIGRTVNRNHATVIHGVQRVERTPDMLAEAQRRMREAAA